MEMRRRKTTVEPMSTPSDSSETGGFSVKDNDHGRCSKVGEAVGGTAAVICCFPFAVINLVVLAVYKVPCGLLKRAWKKKKKLQRRRLLGKKSKNSANDDFEGKNGVGPWPGLILSSDDEEGDEGWEDEKLEEEMLGEFYRGFWRSPSQKGD